MKEEKNEQTLSVIELAEKRFGKEKLAEIKAQYPGRKLNIIVVEDKVALLQPMTAKALSNYTQMVVDPKGGLDTAAKCLFDEVWIGGDEAIREDEEYFISAMMEIQNIIEIKKSSFGKL